SRFMPRLSLTGTVPNYEQAIVPVTQSTDGSTQFRARRETTAAVGMVLSQALPFSGGSFFVSSSIQRVDVGGAQSSGIGGAQSSRVYSSTPVTVGLRQEIFRPNALRWDSREQDLVAIAADRTYVEAREDVALNTANAFFDLYSARLALDNATSKVAINDTLYNLNKGRYEVGKIGENDLLQSEL